jgi:hypothetical protein
VSPVLAVEDVQVVLVVGLTPVDVSGVEGVQVVLVALLPPLHVERVLVMKGMEVVLVVPDRRARPYGLWDDGGRGRGRSCGGLEVGQAVGGQELAHFECLDESSALP